MDERLYTNQFQYFGEMRFQQEVRAFATNRKSHKIPRWLTTNHKRRTTNRSSLVFSGGGAHQLYVMVSQYTAHQALHKMGMQQMPN